MAIFNAPRITTAQRDSLTLTTSEIVFDTNEKIFYGGDGSTVGGFPIGSGASTSQSVVCRNNTGSTIPQFRAVYINGASGNEPTVQLAIANTDPTSSKTFGVTKLPIANNTSGVIVHSGEIDDLNTSAFAEGDLLWLSPTTAGALTNARPSSPNHAVFIGYIIRSHPTLGKIIVTIQNGLEIEELHDVEISLVADNQVLKYDAPNSLWKNETLVKGDVGLGSVDNTSDLGKPVSTAQQIAIDAKVANNLTASTTVAPSKTAVNTALALKVAKAGDTMTGSLTVTGNNGVEFGGIQVNNTNLAGYCAINARADDGEVIQIAALNSGGAANAYGMWSVNEFGLYSKRSLNIMTDTAGAEIKFATGTGATEVAKIDSTGKFSSNGISLNSGTVENVPTPVSGTNAANKSYVDNGLSTKQNSLGFTPENVANKEINFAANTGSDIKYPTIKAVFTWIVGILSGYQPVLGFDPANDTLSNLGGTAVNNSINPDSNVAYTLGASGLNWLSVGTKEVTYDAYPNFDVELRKFVDTNIKDTLDYENRLLQDSSGQTVLDWKNCTIDKDKFDLIGNSFETVSKNLKQYNYTLTYTSGVLEKITYVVPSVGDITKTLNYTSGVLTSVVLSGSTPSSALLTKTLNYTSGVLTSISYT